MINVIHGAGGNAFNALLYPEQNPFHADYFHTQVTNFNNVLTDVGQRFMDTAKAVYDRINDSAAAELARRAIRAAKGMFNSNLIVPIFELSDLQMAQPTMQRWVMANPTIRELYHEQRCSGYADSYVDMQPGAIGESHYDYRRVMSNVIQEDAIDWHAKIYFDELHEGDRELTHHEKFDVLDTWRIVEMFVKQSKDPTDPFGGEL